MEAINRDGIRLVSADRTIVGKPTLATDNLNDVPDPDLLLLCTKSYDLDAAVQAVSSKVDDHTVIIPLLNGADIYDRIRRILGKGVVLPACVFVGTHIQADGVIQQNGGDGKILFGKDPRFPDYYPETVVQAFDDLGINFQWHEDPMPAIWGKYIFIAAFGLVTVYTGQTLGQIMADDTSKRLAGEIMQEIYDIAEAKGIALPKAIIEESLDKAYNFPPDTQTSYQRDVERKGRTNEGDLYGGTLLREGEALKIPTPTTKLLYSKIQTRLAG